MSDEPRGPIVIEDAPWTDFSQGVRYASRWRTLSDTRGPDRRKIGVAIEELSPGKQSCPFHFHMQEEEHIIGIDGEATLRLGEKRYRLRAGDYVCFPAGQRAGHCLINETAKVFRYLMIGGHAPDEVCVYPDSGKISIRALADENGRFIVCNGERLDYWDGERADEPL